MWAKMSLYNTTISSVKGSTLGSLKYKKEGAYRDKSLVESLQEHSNPNI